MPFLIALLFYQCLLASTTETKDNHLPIVLTVAQRIELFGTNCSTNLPNYEIVRLRSLDVSHVRQYRNDVNIKRYQIHYRDESVNFTLKQDDNILSPGCMVHYYSRNTSKTIRPCRRSLAECFYTGVSDSHNGSWIAANTCKGVKGILTIDGSTLVIAPLDKHEVHENHTDLLHVVYHYKKALPSSETASSEDEVIMPGLGYIDRKKRSQGDPRYIETRIAVDQQVYNNHGNNTEDYVQTIFNIAARWFEDKSLGMDIRLCLSDIHIYSDYDSIGVEILPDAKTTLESFCGWISENATTDADCTLLLTRIDMHFGNRSGTVGLANPEAMCKRRSSCMLVQDIGPTTGEVIAHEIGHLIGMKHIQDTACRGQKGIMDKAGPGAFKWTTCSAEDAKNFLRNLTADKKNDCLSNKPKGTNFGVDFDHDAPLPGTIWTSEEQCKLIFGKEAQVCSDPSMSKCERMVCRKTPDSPCILTDSFVVDGTDCNNTRSWCISGNCEAMSALRSVPPIDGSWTEWGSYSGCIGKGVDIGISLRKRRCQNPPPRYGGKDCVGSRYTARLCKMKHSMDDYKTEQCNEVINSKSNTPGNLSAILAYDIKGKECSVLLCVDAHQHQFQYPFISIDGTECNFGSKRQYGRCVEGECKLFGCDGMMDSNMMYDKCGVCNGTGENCRLFTGRYSKNSRVNEYKTVTVIPKGSYSIEVTQININSFISAVVNGKRLFNNGYKMRSGPYYLDGIRAMYNSLPERLEIEGPTPADVIIQVYPKQDYRVFSAATPQIHYEFYQKPDLDYTKYHWNVQQRPCTRSCGLGYILQEVRCVDLSRTPVDEKHCDIGSKPSEERRVCNNFKCPPAWTKPGFGPCSVTCGHGGIRTRVTHCTSYYNGTNKLYRESSCSSQQKPTVTQDCTFVPCPPVWKIGKWSKCSKTCSIGLQTRTVECYYSNGTKTEESRCMLLKKTPEQPLRQKACCEGPCPHTPYGKSCKDLIPNCVQFGGDICYGDYDYFGEKNCSKFCQYCCYISSICECVNFEEPCSDYSPSTDDDPRCNQNEEVCKGRFKDWAAINCPKKCIETEVECKNNVTVSCKEYGLSPCITPIYQAFMRVNCPRFCGFC